MSALLIGGVLLLSLSSSISAGGGYYYYYSNTSNVVTVTSAPPPVSTGTSAPPPAPNNCEVSGWSDWGQCIDGTKTRTRTVTKQAKNNGTACPSLSESQSCPVNCEVSGWSDWGPACDRNNRTQTRTRTVTKQAKNSGTACPTLTETRACPDNPFSWDPFLLYNEDAKTCIYSPSTDNSESIRGFDCGNQLWTYDPDTQLLRYKDNGMCMKRKGGWVQSWACDSTNPEFKWTYDKATGTLQSKNGCVKLYDNQNTAQALGSDTCSSDVAFKWKVVSPSQVSSLEKPVRATPDNFKIVITVINSNSVKLQSPDIPVGNDTDLLSIGISVAGTRGDMEFGGANGVKPSQLRAGYTFSNLNLPVQYYGKDWDVYYTFKGFQKYGGKFTLP